ncbi:MAG: hypothetical protein ACK5NB_11325 [Flavobacteriaceae bacterium]
MKTKTLPIMMLLSLSFVLSCKENPQKRAEQKAQTEYQKAEKHANSAEEHFEKSTNEAAQALEHAAMEERNAAIASVVVPEFNNLEANTLVKKIGNHAIGFTNAKTTKEADKFSNKINEDLTRLSSKIEKGRISKADGTQIKTYAIRLAAAVGGDLQTSDVWFLSL